MPELGRVEPPGPRWKELRGLIWLYLPLFSVGLGYGAVLPILPAFLERLAGGGGAQRSLPLHAGLLTGLYIGAFVIAAPPWGKATDRGAARWVMVAGLLGYASATVWFGLATSLLAMYAARFIAGALAAGLVPATSALIAQRYRGEERVRCFAWMSAASSVGFLFGPALTGWTHGVLGALRLSPTNPLHLTAVPIWTTCAVALVAAVGVIFGVRPARDGELTSDQAAPAAGRSTAPFLRGILLLSGFGSFGLGAFEVGLSLQSQRAWRFSPSELGSLFVVCSAVMLFIQFALYEPLHRRVRAKRLIVGGFAVMAAGLALLTATSSYAWVVSLVGLFALGSGVLLPTLTVAAADAAGANVGTATGIQNAAGNLGQAVGSAAAGLLFGELPLASFPLVALVMLAIAGAAASYGPRAATASNPRGFGEE